MIHTILLFIPFYCAGEFVVDASQTIYQVKENDNFTLEWKFPSIMNMSFTSVNIFCQLFTDVKPLILYQVHEGVEVSESQDGQFSGRVQCDKDALREGRIRLHLSRLRTDDCGVYMCGVLTNDGVKFGKRRLDVTAAAAPTVTTPLSSSVPPKPPQPKPASCGRIFLYVVLGLAAAVAAAVAAAAAAPYLKSLLCKPHE